MDPGASQPASVVPVRARRKDEVLLREPAPGNQVRLLADAQETFPAMLDAISTARDHVHLETYRIHADQTGTRLANALIERARAGVEVRVLADAVGSVFLDAKLFRDIEAAGGRTRLYRPIRLGQDPAFWHRRDHRKILVVDGRVGFVGGSNLSDEHQPTADGGSVWRDTNLRIEGPAVRELAKVFRRTWQSETEETLDARRYLPQVPGLGNHAVVVVSNREWRQRHSIRRAYLRAIHRSRRTIHLTQAYFLPDRGFVRALSAAARRGVEVQVLLGGLSDVPAVQHATRHLYGRLLAHGIQLYEWPDRVLHAKTLCVDGHWSVIGSYNLDHRSFRHNLEIVVQVAGEELGRRMDEVFRHDLERGRKVELESWLARGWWARTQGAFWHALRLWL